LIAPSGSSFLALAYFLLDKLRDDVCGLDLNGNNANFQVGLLSAFIIKTLYFGR